MKIKFLLLLSTIILFSCNFKLVPTYSVEATAKVMSTMTETEILYNKMIAAPNKSFPSYEIDYSLIQTRINELIILNQARKNNKVILILSNDVKNRFEKYKQEHRAAVNLNNAQLRSYKDYMKAVWTPLYNAEINFKP